MAIDWKEINEKREQELQELTDRLEQGIQNLFDSDEYRKYLDCLAKFPKYSLNNSLLIYLTKPDSTLCNSVTGWNKLGRYVKKGEKGIRIFAPAPYKVKTEQEKRDKTTDRVIRDEKGQPVMETVVIEKKAFKPVSTFDITQTAGKELPRPGVMELTGDVKGYETLLKALLETCPVPVAFEEISSGAKGYYNLTDDRIVIQSGMSELQTIKTLVHEMTHQKKDSLAVPKEERKDERTREVIAESTAYVCLRHWKLEPDAYSLMYIGEWSSGRELPELKSSLHEIRDAANEIITQTEEKMQELTRDLQIDLDRRLTITQEAKSSMGHLPEADVPVTEQGGRIR